MHRLEFYGHFGQLDFQMVMWKFRGGGSFEMSNSELWINSSRCPIALEGEYAPSDLLVCQHISLHYHMIYSYKLCMVYIQLVV